MQIQKNKSPRKALIAVAIIVVLALLGIGGYFAWKALSPDGDADQNTSKPAPASDSKPSNSIEPNNNTEREAEKDPVQNDAANVDQNTLSAYITAKNIVGDTLQIRTQIDQYLTSGTCRITIGSYSATAGIVQNPSSSSCAGWDIPLSQLGSGSQTINISIASGDKSATIVGEVSL
jgi:flagellar basal body-associated protein FliL